MSFVLPHPPARGLSPESVGGTAHRYATELCSREEEVCSCTGKSLFGALV